ncbi:MAG: ATP-binding protein [Planctomycetota bacterium]
MTAVAVPVLVVLLWARRSLEYRAEVESLHRFILGRMEDGRWACEESPETFPAPPRPRRADGPREGPESGGRGGPPTRGEPDRRKPGGREERGPRTDGAPRGPGPASPGRGGPPIDLFAYAPDFRSANPAAPPFPGELKDELLAGADRADQRLVDGDRRGIRVAARMAWDEGPCVFVVATRRGEGPGWLTPNQLLAAAAQALALALVACVAAGPIVARVRRLQGEVRRAAHDGYATSVTVAGNDELAQLAREFNEAGAEVRRQFRAVEEREETLRSFVANTTHDVMIPMTVLQGHLAALRDSEGAPDPALLHDAMAEVQYMTSLLRNLAASAKLEAQEHELERDPVELNPLVERVVARHAPIGRQKGIELNHAVPELALRAAGDLTLLEQAASNLVHNAVRYGVAGGHVAVLLAADSADWSLRVIDDGPGIEPELMRRLTQRAARGHEARSRHPEGQGLGLHIAREVARRHGGELLLRRSEHGGLEAELRGPLA